MRVALIQPRSSWGKRPYLPNGLLNAAARLNAVGVKTTIVDLNIDDLDTAETHPPLQSADVLGIGVLGPPYIPPAIELGMWLRERRHDQPIVFGGEPVMRLPKQHFERIFADRIGGDVRQVASDDELCKAFRVSSLRGMPSMYDISAGSVIRALPLRYREIYFSREFCIFTSQGCKYQCNFCAATKGVPERFRNIDVFKDEVDAITSQVHEICGKTAPYEVYLSTLDGCQNPEPMEKMLRIIDSSRLRNNVSFPLRFLATSRETVKAVRKDSEILKRWRDYGVRCIGIGVDGDDEATWARERKRHNKRPEIAAAFDAIKNAGIQPEAFMVIGLPGDSVAAILKGVRACFRFAFKGIRPRPYLGKAHVPGSERWATDEETVERFLSDPNLFRDSEYAGLAIDATHTDRTQRYLANAAFFFTTVALKLSKTGCPTQPLLPTESVSGPLRLLGKLWNSRMPQDR